MNVVPRLARGALVIAIGAIAACGSGSSGGADSPKSRPIASMPPYPDPADKKRDPEPAAPPRPKDPRTICREAANVKAAPGDLGAKQKGWVEGTAASRPSDKARAYGIADLQALEKKGAWEELLEHAEDIAPTQRTASWEKIVERAAIGYLAQLTTDTAAFEGVFTSQQLLKRYPHLLRSQAFMDKRGQAGTIAAERCLREAYRGDHCIDMMKDFLKTSTTAADVGFSFGKITRKNQNHYVAVPFFKWALDKKKDAAMCDDEDLRLAVLAGLGLPPDYENAKGARDIAQNACFDALKAAMEKALVESEGGYYRDNACAVLKAKGQW